MLLLTRLLNNRHRADLNLFWNKVQSKCNKKCRTKKLSQSKMPHFDISFFCNVTRGDSDLILSSQQETDFIILHWCLKSKQRFNMRKQLCRFKMNSLPFNISSTGTFTTSFSNKDKCAIWNFKLGAKINLILKRILYYKINCDLYKRFMHLIIINFSGSL